MTDLITQNENLPTTPEVGVAAAVAREQSEIQAAVFSAKKFPRNEQAARNKALASFERPTLAEGAQYAFPRGGKQIKGPSIDLAVECARTWGNMRYGIRIVKNDEEMVHIKGYALDLENNNYAEFEDEFAKKIQRKVQRDGQSITVWVTPDERDLRELINRRGAICVRNALLRLLPPDLIDDCCAVADKTLQKGAQGGSKQETVNRLTFAFSKLGVSAEMLEERLLHKLDIITPDEIIELQGIYKSMLDGHTKREDHFEVQAVVDSNTEKLQAAVSKKAKKEE
jgi:hypothetical protein